MICDVNICTLLICAQLTDANFYNVCVWAAVASQSMDLTCMDWEGGEGSRQSGWWRSDTETLPVVAAAAGAQTQHDDKH